MRCSSRKLLGQWLRTLPPRPDKKKKRDQIRRASRGMKRNTNVANTPNPPSHALETYSTSQPAKVLMIMPDSDSGMNRMLVSMGLSFWTSWKLPLGVNRGGLWLRGKGNALKSNEILLYVEAPPQEEDKSEECSNTGLPEDAHGEQYRFSIPFLSYFPFNEQNEKENREGEECGDIWNPPSVLGGKERSICTEALLYSPDILGMTEYREEKPNQYLHPLL